MAREHGIYVSIMLFEGWGIQFSPDSYRNHPFYPDNNINNLGLDTANDRRLEIHELVNPKVLEMQESYLRKVIETVNDLDNVLYEISNENHPPSTAWQYHMINFIKEYEKKLGNSHPVGMTFQYRGGSNKTLFDSPADWISPNPDGGYRESPPASDGSKVILNDTDHLWGIGGTPQWVWESFLRGMNPLFMDPYDGKVLMQSFDTTWADLVRRNMGYTNDYARQVDLEHMIPMDGLASSGYCLASKGNEYLVYDPKDSVMTVDLSGISGNFLVEWLNPYSGEKSEQPSIQGGAGISFTPPFHSDFSILYLKKE